MPPLAYSRHYFCNGIKDDRGNLLLTDRTPYRYRDRSDNRFHTVKVGDTFHTLAERYFDGATDEPALLWWIIPDYQPEPILDPTLRLTPGRVLAIPSIRCVTEEIFSEGRRDV